jgi:benzodiazapine receptor
MITTRHAMGLLILVAICLGAGAVGSLFTSPSIPTWYATLQKPSWTPPSWLFAPVWTLLYLAMAVAAWLVWRKGGLAGAKLALALFAFQLILNVCWSAIFFSARMPGLAFAEIVLLWLMILATIIAFRPISQAGALLMLPYLLWVGFASALNFAIWRLNA